MPDPMVQASKAEVIQGKEGFNVTCEVEAPLGSLVSLTWKYPALQVINSLGNWESLSLVLSHSVIPGDGVNFVPVFSIVYCSERVKFNTYIALYDKVHMYHCLPIQWWVDFHFNCS